MALTSCRKTIIFLLDESSKSIREASKTISPIVRTEYVHNRNGKKESELRVMTIYREDVKRKTRHCYIEHATHGRVPLRPIINPVPDLVIYRTQIKRKCTLPTISSTILSIWWNINQWRLLLSYHKYHRTKISCPSGQDAERTHVLRLHQCNYRKKVQSVVTKYTESKRSAMESFVLISISNAALQYYNHRS